MLSGSNIGAMGVFWGFTDCCLFPAGGLMVTPSKALRIGEKGIVWGAVENCGGRGGATEGRVEGIG